jgi:hypothetical protein
MGARSGAGRKHLGDPGSEPPVVLHQRAGELWVPFETIAESFGQVFKPARVAKPLAVTPLEAVPTTDRDVSGLLEGILVLASHGTALLPRLRHGLDDSDAPLVTEGPRWTISHLCRVPVAGSARRLDRDLAAEVAYEVGSTTLVTTQRCLPILRSRTNPSFS